MHKPFSFLLLVCAIEPRGKNVEEVTEYHTSKTQRPRKETEKKGGKKERRKKKKKNKKKKMIVPSMIEKEIR